MENKPKVLILSGSPHTDGTTARALSEVKVTLESEGMEVEYIQVGHLDVPGCRGCYACGKLKKCAIDDIVNEIAEKLMKKRKAHPERERGSIYEHGQRVASL